MASTLTRILVHITFSTKGRANLIPAAIESDLRAYIGGICRNHECTALAIGGTADHVHLLVGLSKTMAISSLLMHNKRDSSKWMHGQGMACFAWQEGYFAFSIGQSAVESLRAYIARQHEHHHTIDYQAEVRAFLRKYEVEFDERYVWS